MSRETLVRQIGEWLIDQALSEPDIIEIFDQLCHRLYGIGVPIVRARLTWPTLHPLFRAETILWRKGAETEFEQFRHQEEVSEAWLTSPMAYMFDHGVEEIRRNLDGPNKMIDFPILQELADEGMTDYLIVITGFDGQPPSAYDAPDSGKLNANGIILSWSCDRPGGFTDDDIVALKQIQRRFAVAVKTVVQRRIAANITETYLGRQAGAEVLDGAIKLGDGKATQAVVWYTDMRRSTSLADTMAPDDFLDMLNAYFACTAGPAIEFGGEVLDFIGDAVLAIFPFENDIGKQQAIRCAIMAMEQALECKEQTNAERRVTGKVPFEFGIGINVGWLTFGNIGVESRLSFSVIGPTINEVERIEALTKVVEADALVTAEIVKQDPERWMSIGHQQLEGVSHECELFVLKERGELVASPVPQPERMTVN